MYDCKERTIHVEGGLEYIYLYNGSGKPIRVQRMRRADQLKCCHDWYKIKSGFQGHGKWRRGCVFCGALCR